VFFFLDGLFFGGIFFPLETLECISVLIGFLAVWWHNKPKTKNLENKQRLLKMKKKISLKVHCPKSFSVTIPGHYVCW